MMKTPPPDPRLERARYGLLLDTPFFGSLMVRLRVEPGYPRETFCTDGVRIRYHQGYADSLGEEELKYILCHEILHCALGHIWRTGGRDLAVWNRACDYVVNQMLDDYAAGAKPAPWIRPQGLLDVKKEPQYRGLSAEEIYALMMQEKQPPPPPAGNGSGQDSQDLQDGQDSAMPGKNPGNPDNPANPVQENKPGPGDFEPAAPDSEPQPGQEAGAESGLEADWQIATAQAERLAQMKGNCPGAASELVNQLKAPKVSWRDVLREFIRQRAKNDWSFARPNRRHLGRGFVLPSLHSERMGRLVAAFDSSGSTRRYVADFATEVQAALDECQPERLDVIVCDAAVQHVQSFEPGDAVTIDAKGGGGTDFRPVFEVIDDPQKAAAHDLEEFDDPPLCVVYLTDLDGSFPAQDPGYPVLWCVPAGARCSRTPPPFGEIISVQ